MKIAIGSDHAGFEMKERLKDILKELGHQLQDHGTDSNESCDYPDFAAKVARDVSNGEAERGILICGSGVGMSITANKFCGIRAALCVTEEIAKLSRNHNDSNVLCMGSRILSEDLLKAITKTWLTSDYEGGRHQKRIDKITAFEK